MSETAVVQVAEVKEGATGTSAKGAWTRYDLIDGNGQRYATFSKGLYESAKPFAGQKAEVEYEQQEKGLKLIAVKAAANGDTPALGTGDYITGQKPSIEVRRIAAAVAWKEATHLADIEMRHKVGQEITPALIQDAAQKYANQIFVDLLRKGNALTDEDIPF
jgi:hypothetical protein